MSLICAFYLCRARGETKSESLLEILESREDLVRFVNIFHLIEVCEVWELFKVRKLKLLTPFSKHKAFFTKLLTFSFIEPHATNFFITDCKNLFSTKSHEIHLEIEWYLFLHDPEWESYHMKSSSIFQFLVKFSLPVHDFGCLAHFVKFVSLSTCSTQNHVRIGNQVHDLLECIFNPPESFHHL